MLHLLDLSEVTGDLLLDLALVFLEVGESLLQVQVLLALKSDALVIGLADELETGHEVGHVVRVLGFKLVSHSFDFAAVGLNGALVLLELLVRLQQQAAQILNVLLHILSASGGGPVPGGASHLGVMGWSVVLHLKSQFTFIMLNGNLQLDEGYP